MLPRRRVALHRIHGESPWAETTYGSCWKALFERAFIAGHMLPLSIPGSLEYCGVGLRVSLDLLVSISGIERTVFREGFVLTGLRTALVSIRVINERPRSIQWHLIEYHCSEGWFRSTQSQEEFRENLVPKDRLLERDLNDLKGVAYVGWFETVKILYTPDQVRYLTPSQVKDRWIVNQDGLQFGGQSGMPEGIALARNRGRVNLRLLYLVPEIFSQRIAALYRGTVIIYDDGGKTAWFCSTIDLIIFMLGRYLSANNYHNLIPFAESDAISQEHEECLEH